MVFEVGECGVVAGAVGGRQTADFSTFMIVLDSLSDFIAFYL